MKRPNLSKLTFWDTGSKSIPILSLMPAIPPVAVAAHPAVAANRIANRNIKKATPHKSVAFFHVTAVLKKRTCMSDLTDIIKDRRSIRKYEDR